MERRLKIEKLHTVAGTRQIRTPDYSLIWIRSGKGELCFHEQSYPLEAQRIFLLQPAEYNTATLIWEGSGWLIRLEPWLMRAFFQHYPEEKFLPIFRNNKRIYVDVEPTRGFVMHTLTMFMLQERDEGISLKLVQAYLNAFLLHLAHSCRLNHQLPKVNFNFTLAEKLLLLINMQFKEERSPAFYAMQLGVSIRKLNSTCKKACGKLVTELVNEELLAEAERLLGENALSIKEIAYELDFADMAQFNHFIKRHTGISPTAFRRQVLANN